MQCSLNNHRSLEKTHNRLLNTPFSKILHQKKKKMHNYLTIAQKNGRPRNLPQIQLGLNTIANKKSK